MITLGQCPAILRQQPLGAQQFQERAVSSDIRCNHRQLSRAPRVVWLALLVFLLCFRPSRLGGTAGGFRALLFRELLRSALAAFLSELRKVFANCVHGF